MSLRLGGVIALLVLAGCTGFTVPSERTDTVTAAPVPSIETATEAGPFPPGVTERGVRAPETLLQAHSSALDGRSYTWRSVEVTTRGAQNATETKNHTQIARVHNETTHWYWTNHRTIWRNGRARQLGNYTEYADPTGQYVRYESFDGNSGTDTSKFVPVRARIHHDASHAISRYLTVDSATVRQLQIGGERFSIVEGKRDRQVGPRWNETYTVRATIEESGLVSEITATSVYTTSDDRKTVTHVMKYDRIGSTDVSRPDWVDRT